MELRDDYAMARYNVNRLGRFASPDLLAGSAADLRFQQSGGLHRSPDTGPQSLNRYAGVYPERSRRVLNDPVNFVDPLGQRFSYICGFTHECVGGGAGLRSDEACGGPFSLGCDGGGFDSGDTCFTAVCQSPGDVLLDGFVTDRGEAEPIVGAGFGFVCPTTDCSGATLTTFNGVDSAIRVPNCSDPTVEDCGYSYYLTNGSTGTLGLTGAWPGDDGAAGGGAPGPAQPQNPQSRSQLQACLGQAAASRNEQLLRGGVEAAAGAGLLAAGGAVIYLGGPALFAEGALVPLLTGDAFRLGSVVFAALGTGGYAVVRGVQTITHALAQYSQAAAACQGRYGPS